MKIIKLIVVTKKCKRKEMRDKKQYNRLVLCTNQGGLSRKLIAEYKNIHGK